MSEHEQDREAVGPRLDRGGGRPVPKRAVLGKMRMLIRRGLVDGCPCGCRGDFEITPKGQAWLAAYRETPNVAGKAPAAPADGRP